MFDAFVEYFIPTCLLFMPTVLFFVVMWRKWPVTIFHLIGIALQMAGTYMGLYFLADAVLTEGTPYGQLLLAMIDGYFGLLLYLATFVGFIALMIRSKDRVSVSSS